MDASTLRWILIVIGVVVVGSIFLFGNPSKKKAPKASPRRKKTRDDGGATRREPTLDSTQPEASDDLFADVEEGGQGELAIDDEPAPEPVADETPRLASVARARAWARRSVSRRRSASSDCLLRRSASRRPAVAASASAFCRAAASDALIASERCNRSRPTVA